MRKVLIGALMLMIALPGWVLADGGDDHPVSRDESLALKTAVKAALAALGAPPAGYAQSAEDYDLPTSMGWNKQENRFWLTETHADFEFTSGKTGEQLGLEYQQKIAAAQGKGDYEAMQRLVMEMNQAMAGAMNAEMSKIEVTVALNRNPHQTIDPEGVIWESPGAIALRNEPDGTNTVVLLAFDPKALADTKQLSLVDLSETVHHDSDTKTAVRTIVVELKGPEAAVVEWVNNVDRDAMLGLITR